MDPPSKSVVKSVVVVADPLWRRHVRDPERIAVRALALTGTRASVVLAGDAAVKRLNAKDRGSAKPTNVLTYARPPEIILALGVILREARASGRRPAHHLAHLVVHGGLHLAGCDHHRAGEARRMERFEARLLSRLGVPNPWRHG